MLVLYGVSGFVTCIAGKPAALAIAGYEVHLLEASAWMLKVRGRKLTVSEDRREAGVVRCADLHPTETSAIGMGN